MPYLQLDECRQRLKKAELLGHEIAYWQEGQGESLLLIHGFPSAAWDWHKIWEPLTKRYSVVALDLLGYGFSDKPFPHSYSLLEQASIIEALMSLLNIDKTHILSHDYGDSVAQELLHRHVRKSNGLSVSSLCLLNGGLFSEHHRPLLTQTLLNSALGPLIASFIDKSSLSKSFNKIFAKNTPPTPDEIDVLWELMLINQGKRVLPSMIKYINERKIHRDNWVAAMQKYSGPLCFINGTTDPISGQHMADAYAQLIPNQSLVLLECGHYPQIEMPQQTLESYLAFMQA